MSKGTRKRSVRIDDDLWAQIQEQAKSDSLDVSTLIRQLLRGWLNMHDDIQGEK